MDRMIWTRLGAQAQGAGSWTFWRSWFRVALVLSVTVAVIMLAFTAVLVVLPLALLSALALRTYLRHKLAKGRPARTDGPIVIDGEYTVITKEGPRF